MVSKIELRWPNASREFRARTPFPPQWRESTNEPPAAEVLRQEELRLPLLLRRMRLTCDPCSRSHDFVKSETGKNQFLQPRTVEEMGGV